MRGDGWDNGPRVTDLGATPDAECRVYYNTLRPDVNVALVRLLKGT